MEILSLIPKFYANFIIAVLVFTRIVTMLTTINLFRRGMISARLLISLSAILTFYVMVLNDMTPISADVFSATMLIAEFSQFFIGFCSGLVVNIIFDVFLAFGQIVATQIGLSILGLFDPRLGSITVLTQFYMFVATILFLSLNGHLFAIKIIVESFQYLSPTSFISHYSLEKILSYANVIFSGSILMGLTIIVVMLLTNVTLATMTKFAPQVNLFSIGINLTLVIGLICLIVTFDLFINSGESQIHNGMNFLYNLMVSHHV